MDEALLAYLVIDVGVIVWRACPDAFKLGNANPDLRETSIVFESDIIVGHPVHLLLWRAAWNQGAVRLDLDDGVGPVEALLALWASMIAAVRHHHICVDTASFMMVVMQRLRELWLGQVWIDHHRCGKDGTASTLLGSSQPPSASA